MVLVRNIFYKFIFLNIWDIVCSVFLREFEGIFVFEDMVNMVKFYFYSFW